MPICIGTGSTGDATSTTAHTIKYSNKKSRREKTGFINHSLIKYYIKYYQALFDPILLPSCDLPANALIFFRKIFLRRNISSIARLLAKGITVSGFPSAQNLSMGF